MISKLILLFLMLPVVIISQTIKIDYYSEFLKTKKKYISYTTETFHGDSILTKSFSDEFSYFNNGFSEKRTTFSANGIINVTIDSTIYSEKKPNQFIVKSYTMGNLCYTYKTVSKPGVIKRYTNKKLESVSKYNIEDSTWTLVEKSKSNQHKTRKIDKKSTLTYYEYICDTLVSTAIYYKHYIMHERFEWDSLVQFDSKGVIFSKKIYSYNMYGDVIKEQGYDPHQENPYISYNIYEYKYDENGNWTELKETRKNNSSIKWYDKPKIYSDWISVQKRSIIY